MTVHRLRSSMLWGWASLALGGVIIVVQLIASGLADAHVAFGLAVASAAVGAACFLRPGVVIGDDAVELRNVTHVAVAPYARVANVALRWALVVTGDDGTKASAFAVPRGGAQSARRPVEEGSAEHIAADVEGAVDDWRAAQRGASSAAVEASGPAVRRQPDWIGIGLVVAAVAGAATAFLL